MTTKNITTNFLLIIAIIFAIWGIIELEKQHFEVDSIEKIRNHTLLDDLEKYPDRTTAVIDEEWICGKTLHYEYHFNAETNEGKYRCLTCGTSMYYASPYQPMNSKDKHPLLALYNQKIN